MATETGKRDQARLQALWSCSGVSRQTFPHLKNKMLILAETGKADPSTWTRVSIWCGVPDAGQHIHPRAFSDSADGMAGRDPRISVQKP